MVVVLIILIVCFLYWWFVPWRLVLRPFKLSGLKLANPDSLVSKQGERILAITAHIDDLEFFCGGTMAHLREQGAKTWLIIGTENYKWYYSSKKRSKEHTEKRKAEQAKVAEYLGYEKVVYLGYPDYRLKNDSESVGKVKKLIEEFKPNAILTFDVIKGPSVQHRDHTAAGIITLKAAQKSHTNAKIFMFSTALPNFYVDVTDTLEDKWTALRIFKTEFKENDFVFAMLKKWARSAGKKAGTKYAESYRVVEFER